MHLFVILFFNLLQTTISSTILARYCNILQYAIIISIFSIGHIVLYYSSKYCNIAIFRYIVSPLIATHMSHVMVMLDVMLFCTYMAFNHIREDVSSKQSINQLIMQDRFHC